ncbi:hypothetical protein HYR99_05835 [Candidatus Poribacteria bacterium]|nr:hypothetical protein [Candidatus Poribacteria bacterium]
MITKIEPTGVILNDICEIKTNKCIARNEPGPITAVWSLPGRTQINVCRPCMDEMVRRGEWEVEGARIKRRADIAIFDNEGKVKLIAEVKYTPTTEDTAKRATQIRRNLLVHSGIPSTPFLLVAFPDKFYLWKKKSPDSYDRSADYRASAKSIVKKYSKAMEIPSENMTPKEFEMLISQWLKDLISNENEPKIPEWANKSGLYDAIKEGKLVVEATL